MAKQLQIDGLLDRRPSQLSGGQRQRVALGRAMVRQPAAFLMDEPLSNLDAKLRVHMRSELAELHARIGTTFIYVTHDQVEAMTMSDRVAMMDNGDILQLGRPGDLYARPANVRVAQFIGTPGDQPASRPRQTPTASSSCSAAQLAVRASAAPAGSRIDARHPPRGDAPAPAGTARPGMHAARRTAAPQREPRRRATSCTSISPRRATRHASRAGRARRRGARERRPASSRCYSRLLRATCSMPTGERIADDGATGAAQRRAVAAHAGADMTSDRGHFRTPRRRRVAIASG